MTTISSTDKNITLESLFSLLAPHWLAGNLLLAMAYFLTGNLGLLLAIPPGFATAVWPASGIALGWILLYGWRLLPGVVCGSFAVNLVVTMNASGLGLFDVGWTVSGLIALGAAAQAWLGAALIRRYVDLSPGFEDPNVVIKTLALGGLVATLLNACWSVSVLYVSGHITLDRFLQNC